MDRMEERMLRILIMCIFFSAPAFGAEASMEMRARFVGDPDPYSFLSWQRACCIGEDSDNPYYNPHPYCVDLKEMGFLDEDKCARHLGSRSEGVSE